jgi:hypothetical protein
LTDLPLSKSLKCIIFALNLIIKLQNMELFLLTLLLLGLAFAGIAIKIWAKKDGKFAGTCASQNPYLNQNGEACGFCGKTPDQFDSCKEPQHQEA